MTDSLSVLTHPHALAVKRFYVGPSGKVLVDDYGKGKRFECIQAPVDGFDSLATRLEALLDEPHAFVIRGEPVPGRDLTEILRTKLPRDGEPPGFREVPRRWVMIDCDQALTREDVADLDFARPEDCETGVNRILGQLPLELRTASVFWQLSSSAGFKPGLRAHLWYWLDRPMGERELTRWAENVNDLAGRRLVDPSVFRTVQPNYTANPILDVGVVDPVGKRWGVLKSAKDELSLPRLAERAGAYLRKLEPLRDPRNENVRDPIMRACASYFCARSPEAPSEDLLRALRRAVDQSCAMRGVVDSKYDDAELAKYIEGGRKFARERGAIAENLASNNDGSLKPTLENARAIMMSSVQWDGVLGYDARKDQPLALVEPPFADDYKGPAASYPRQWDDADDMRASIWLQRHERSLIVSKATVRDAVTVTAKQQTFDKIQDYLRGLYWDGEARLDTWLIRYCGVADSRYARKVASMTLIQAVARALEPGCKADGVLVLEGPQGRRKSSLLRDLFGGIEFFREGIGDIHHPETWKALQAAWGVELREMAGISNREVEAVKTFLDKQNDHYRGSYDMRPTDHPRRCVFTATTNLGQYLRDDTGARRWWPVTVVECDLDGFAEVRDQLWAEAVHRYRAQEPWWVEADDPDFVREQDARYDRDEREDQLREALDSGAYAFATTPRTPAIPAKAASVTVAQVLEHHWNVPIKDQTKGQQMIVASLLKRIGWERRDNPKRWIRA